MRDHLSVSQINLYLACPLKYRFVYVDEIPRPFKSSGLTFGSAIHSTIEWLHKERIAGKSPNFDDLHRIFCADWEALKIDNIQFKDGESEDEIITKGNEVLKLYFESIPDIPPKAAELPFRVPLINIETEEQLDLPLEGVIDLIEEDDTVVELKTSSRSIDPQTLSQHLQLTAYSYAYLYIYKKKPNLRLDNLIKSKTARIETFQVKRDKEDYVRLFHIAKEVLKGIKFGYFCPNHSWMCNDCEYFEDCQKWEG